MATYSDPNGRTGLGVNMRESFKGEVTRAEGEGQHPLQRPSKKTHQLPANGKTRLSAECSTTDSNASESSRDRVASFSTNNNAVVCLPLVSEGLKLVWTQSDQTRELDSIPELVQAFNVFPYPTSREVNALARLCALPLDKVKVWFMVQRIKYGISWASEEIEETRRKLAGPELAGDCAETKEEMTTTKSKTKRIEEEAPMEAEDNHRTEGTLPAPSSQVPPRKRLRYETPEPCKPAKTVPCFSSSLPPPEDSYYYRPPADLPGSTAVDTSLDLSRSSPQQRRHGRYKKSKAQLAVLRSSFLRQNWPAEAELRRLQEETGICRNDIRKWFSDSRYQLRNGRGLVSGASHFYPAGAGLVKTEAQQVLPLPLVANKARHEQNGLEERGGAPAKGGRGNSIKDSHFFQTFLSNSIEAFGERAAGVKAEVVEEEAAVHSDTPKGAESEVEEEKPLQLVKLSSKEPEVPQPPPLSENPVPSPSSSPSLSVSPPPTATTPTVAPTTATPPTIAPPTVAPPTIAPPTVAPPTVAPPTVAPPTVAPPTVAPPTVAPPTAAPPTKRLSGSSQKPARAPAKASSSLTAQPLSSATPTSSSSSSPSLTPAGRPRKTKEQLDVLKQHFLRCQWPTSEDYSQLVELTGLPRADVIQWFGDTRYAVKNGQLRWVQGVREQLVAVLAVPPNGGGVSNGNGSGGTPRGGGGGRKRRSQANGATTTPTSSAAADSPDVGPLEAYHRSTGALQEKDLDSLCKKSRMGYQLVRDWFASQESNVEPNVTD